MNSPAAHGSERLCHAILEDARGQRDEILRRAQDAVKAILAKADAEARAAAAERLQAASAEGQRRREAILATLPMEVNRLKLAQIEEGLERIRNRVLQAIQENQSFDWREALVHLTVQALRPMSGSTFFLRLSRADLDGAGDSLAAEIERRAARPLLRLELGEDPEIRKGEWILQDEEGRQIWELGLEARLERLWPELRRQIAAQCGLVSLEEQNWSAS